MTSEPNILSVQKMGCKFRENVRTGEVQRLIGENPYRWETWDPINNEAHRKELEAK